MSKHHMMGLVSLAALSAMAGQALAEDPATVGEVVVTAQKVEQRAIDVPAAMSVFTREYFENTRTVSFEDLGKATPGLIIDESVGSTYTNIAIRGIGSDALNSGVESSVGVFIDGVYQGRPASLAADLADVERIEVLRGPQGTLYGKNTNAGAINIISRAPTGRFEADGRLYVGDYGAVSGQGAVSLPLSDKARLRLSAYGSRRDGYIDNAVPGVDADEFKRYGARARLDVDVTDRLDVSFKLAADTNDISIINYGLLTASPGLSFVAGLFGVTLPTDIYGRVASANFEPYQKLDQVRTSLTANYDLGGDVTLTSITAYQRFHDKNNADVDYTSLDLLDGGSDTRQNQFSQEVRISNDPDSRFSYVAGVFYFLQNQRDFGFNTVRPDLELVTGGAFPTGAQDVVRTRTRVQSAAAFGQATWKVTDKLSATLGLRFDDQRNRQDRVQPLGDTLPDLGSSHHSKSENNTSGSISLQYAFAPKLKGYATISRGYKGGGYNGYGVGALSEISFLPEEATNYELGLKGVAWQGRVSFDATVYVTKLKDLQVSNFNGTTFVVGNAAEATTQGVEANTSVRPTREWLFNAALSQGEATYDSYPGAPCTAAQSAVAVGTCTQDLAGKTLASSPKFHGTLSAQYERPVASTGLDLLVRADYAHFSSQYLQTALAAETLQDAYGVLNARIGVRDHNDRWGLFVTAANLTDEDYLRNAYDFPLFSGAYLAAPGQPRTWGVELQAKF